MLIATLPPVHMDTLLEEIIEHPLVGGVRYNVGGYSAYPALETLERILDLTTAHGKKFWLDIKGRQLRITRWTIADLGMAVLNHDIEVDLPARVWFRGDDCSTIKAVNGNTIYIDPLPKYAPGEGQAINIHGSNLQVFGYMTEDDREYVSAACKLGVTGYMLSFVESMDDVNEVESFLDENGLTVPRELVFKIESPKGMDFVLDLETLPSQHNLMAARDDWFINTSPKPEIIRNLRQLVTIDPEAILASHIFGGLEKAGTVTMADLSDLYLMRQFGYRNFMLSDGISKRHFHRAVKAWEEFLEIFPEEDTLL